MIRSIFDRIFRKGGKVEDEIPTLPPGNIGLTIDLWIAQATSLRELRRYDLEQRKFEIAEAVALKRHAEQPNSMDALHSLGRIYLEAQKPENAAEIFLTMKDIGTKVGSAYWEESAITGLAHVSRLQATMKQSLGGRNINGIFYACQACGHLILFLGTHCPHCRFAPSTPHEVAVGIVLSTYDLKVPSLLHVSRRIQQNEKPADFISDFEKWVHEATSMSSVSAVQEKLKTSHADDFLDFHVLDTCQHCGVVARSSWLRECKKCQQPFDRPDLVNLAVCTHYIVQHFVWGMRESEPVAFSEFVTLLLNIEGKIIRHQKGPTDAEREWARQLMIAISPLWTENGGGTVKIKSPNDIRGTVVDKSIHPQLEEKIMHLEAELRYFAYLTSDQVGLF